MDVQSKEPFKTVMSISKFTVHGLAHKLGLLHTVDAEFSEETLHMVYSVLYLRHTHTVQYIVQTLYSW